MAEAVLLATTECTAPLAEEIPKVLGVECLLGKKTQKEERDRRESLPELLVLLKNYGKKQLNLPKHSQYQKEAEVGAL